MGTKTMEADLNKALNRAISIGEAKAKAVEQRIAGHLKNTKRFLQVELNESVERAADNVLKIMEGKRQKIADNYLSLKAYAVASADKVTDYVSKGQGRALSSIGDLLQTIGSLGPVKAKPAEGLGMGGDSLPEIFSGNFVYINGRSVGLSNKLSDFASLAARMTTYESVLAKLTAHITAPKIKSKFYAKPPEWEGQ